MPALSALDPQRVLDGLAELRELTADADGAQRLCWTPTWDAARRWLTERVRALGDEIEIELDAAGNQWATLRGASPRALVLGSHLDSVANGGWLDGALGVVAGLEVLRALAATRPPDGWPITIRLVDWADEEGARFGRSLIGSSAAAGTLEPGATAALHDADGVAFDDVLAGYGLDPGRLTDARAQLAGAAAYLELHIEQGPLLEAEGLPLAVVLGTLGVERHLVRLSGRAAHVVATSLHLRRDALAGAARVALEVREIARRAGGVSSVGHFRVEPNSLAVIAEQVELVFELNHLDGDTLAAMLAETRAAVDRIAEEEQLAVAERTLLWRMDPLRFDAELAELGADVLRELGAPERRMASGPLHDAAEVHRAGVPTAMLFVQSRGGISHNKDEDSGPEHLRLAVRALGALAQRTLERLTAGQA